MKKSLLVGLLATCASLSSFAIENGQYIYTRDGAYLVQSNPEPIALTAEFTGWTAISATEGNTCDKIFTYSEGVINQTATATSKEGMYYQFAPKAGVTIVSFQIRQEVGASPYSTNTSYGQAYNADRGCYGMDKSAGFNYVNVIANSDGFTSDSNFKSCGTEVLLTPDWQTVNFACSEVDGLDLYLIISGMNSGVQIKDIQVASAIQMADMRQVKLLKDRVNTLINARDWGEDENIVGLQENLEALNAITEASAIAEYEDIAQGVNEALQAVFEGSMENYIAAQAKNTDFSSFTTKTQKTSTFGDWKAVTNGGRWFKVDGCADGEAIHAPHFGGATTYFRETSKMEMTKTLSAGTYYFQLSGAEWVFYNGTPYTGATNNYMKNLGLNKGEMTLYIKKGEEIVATQTIPVPVTDVDNPIKSNTAAVAFNVTEDGEYTFGFSSEAPFTTEENTYYGCGLREDGSSKGFGCGGSFAFTKPVIYCKLAGRSAAEKAYIAAVQAQIKAGRDNYDAAIENLAKEEMKWGKPELQACVDTMGVKLQKYEAMDEDAIGATFDKDAYEPGATSENGLLEHEVYVEVARDLIAANKTFTAVNDTLASLGKAIVAAEGVRAARVYSGSTGGAAFDAIIAGAKDLDAKMQESQYSEENAAAIVAKNEELAKGANDYKALAVPSKVFVDIDFNTPAVDNDGLYSITGALGTMTFSDFVVRTAPASSTQFEQGFQTTAEQNDSTGILRVGNGEGTVEAAIAPVNPSDIIKISFDYYFGALTKGYCGFYVKDAEGNSVTDYYACKYDGVYTSNPMGIDLGKYNHVGSSSASNLAIAAASNATHFDIYLDYGTNEMYCDYGTNGAVNTTDPVEMTNLNEIAQFVVKSGYSNADRRCWFDNLKIVNMPAAAVAPGIKGDANGDGTVSVADLSLMASAILGETVKINKKNADINEDGEITVADLAAVAAMILGAE